MDFPNLSIYFGRILSLSFQPDLSHIDVTKCVTLDYDRQLAMNYKREKNRNKD
jgi:hypothetical protein